MNKEVKNFIRMLKERGWHIERRTGSGHIKMAYGPGGSTILPLTPSDHRWLLNAQSDCGAVEKKYGPYIKKKKVNGSVGLDYQKPEESPMELVKPNTPVPSEPIIQIRTVVKNLTNKSFVISMLEKRRDEILAIIGPHLQLFEEWGEVKQALTDLTGEAIVSWKGQDMKSVTAKIQHETPEPTVVHTRMKIEDVYKFIRDTVIANNNEMKFDDLCDWATQVKGIQASQSQSVKTKLILYINQFNDKYPGNATLSLWPENTRSYESVRYKPQI